MSKKSKSNRRWSKKTTVEIKQVPVAELMAMPGPREWDRDTLLETLTWRLGQNVLNTGHPWHHKTADGTIVDGDTTSVFILSRLSPETQERVNAAWNTRFNYKVLPTVPEDRLHYGFELYPELH